MALSICLGSFKYSIKNFLINLVSGLTFCLPLSLEWINGGSEPLCLESRLSKSRGSSQAYRCRECEHHSPVWCYLRDSRFVWFIRTPLYRCGEGIFPVYFKDILAVGSWGEGSFVFHEAAQFFTVRCWEVIACVYTYRHIPRLDRSHNTFMCYWHMALNHFTKRIVQPKNLTAFSGV